MNPILANALVEIICDAGGEAQIYENYSGRGMFGKSTTGIYSSESNMGDILGYVIQEALNGESSRFNDISSETESNKDIDVEKLVSPLDVKSLRSDSLGLGVIIY